MGRRKKKATVSVSWVRRSKMWFDCFISSFFFLFFFFSLPSMLLDFILTHAKHFVQVICPSEELLQFLSKINPRVSLSLVCNYKLLGFILPACQGCSVLCRCSGEPWALPSGILQFRSWSHVLFVLVLAPQHRGWGEDQHLLGGSLGRKTQSLQGPNLPSPKKKKKKSPIITCFLLQPRLLKLRALILSLRRPPSD